ncbi:MAG: hypothetical protein IJ639_07025 [Ruminococcus sp.]|nr:hypothetical protein [Ruminococcus sp.]
MDFTHINDEGRARMVDVSEKAETCRTATASATVNVSPDTMHLIRTGGVKKGDVLYHQPCVSHSPSPYI